MLDPLPTQSGLPFRGGTFETLAACLDYAADGASGLTFYTGRGAINDVLPYRALRDHAVSLGRKMLRAGLVPGDRVALIAETESDFVRMFFACQYVGLIPAPMPLPVAFGGRATYIAHLRRMIEVADATAAFGPRTLSAWTAEAVDGLGLVLSGTIDDIEAVPEDGVDLPTVNVDALAYLQFSSGSTRFPMGIAVTHKALMSNLRAITAHGLGIGPGDRCTSWLPFYHDMGLVGFLLTPVATQMSLDLLPTREFARRPLLWPRLISANRGTLSFSPSFGYELCGRRAETSAPDDLDLSCWRAAGIGGDMIRPHILRRFAEAFGPSGFRESAFVASYGMAEATLAISFAPLDTGLSVDNLDVGRLERDDVATPADSSQTRARSFVRCGPVLDGHELEVRDSTGAVLPENRVGRIFVRGPSLMREYFAQPLATQAVRSSDGWLDTGDRGYLVDGHVVITGRDKDLILVNGRNIAPQDLEWTAEHEVTGLKPSDVAAFSLDDGDGETVMLLVQCRFHDPAKRRALEEDVAAVTRRTHGVDCRVVLVPHNSLPHTSSGKLSRSRARQFYLDGLFQPVAEATGAA